LFILLAACASVAGALVSRMAARQSELSIRLALGGSRARIVRQLLTESAVLATLAGVLGLAIACALLSTSGALVERQLATATPGGAVALRPTMAVLALSLMASTICGLALGAVPAVTFLRLDRKSAASLLVGPARGAAARTGGTRIRRVLISGQVTLAMVLMFGAGLMFRTIARINAIEFGFRPDGLMKASMMLPLATYPDSTAKRQVVDRVLARVSEVEGVQSAAAVFPYPFRGGAGRFPVLTQGFVDEETAPRAGIHTVTPGYFETMKVQVRAGRDFRPTDDHAGPLVVVISDGLARRLSPDGNVLGRRIRIRVPYLANFNDPDERPWRTIVGVVADVKEDLTPDEPPDVYVPYAQNPRTYLGIVVRTDRAEPSIFLPVKRAVASVDPALALSNVGSMTSLIAAEGGQRRGLSVLLGAFAAFALGLSALAFYASLSYTVIQRRSELAVRMAVGADARSILQLVVTEGLATAAVGVAAGVVASLALGRVLANQLYGVGTGDATTLVSISLLLTFVASVACLVPGVRATRTDPALVLRE
jgi:predicted permease